MNIKNENLENVLSTGSGVLNLGSIHVEHTWDTEMSIKFFSSNVRVVKLIMFLRNTKYLYILQKYVFSVNHVSCVIMPG